MAVKTRVELKVIFVTGAKPSATNFADVFDSFLQATDLPTFAAIATTGAWADISGKPAFFSGAYADLTGKPTLFSGAWADVTGKPTFAAIATSGAWADISGKPTFFSGAYADLTGKPTLFSGAWADISGKPTFAAIATSGAWADISGKPTFFSGAYADLTGKPTLFSGAYADLTGKPTLFSGAYSDLTGKPTLSAASGTAVNFVSDKRFGTVTTPESANITADYTGAVAGSTICIVHQAGTAPTFPADFKRVGTVAYDTTKVNFIWAIFTGDGSRVEYLITQEA